jgi:acyl-CoA reductase-like NAD-dependent aldehyde dehydrogenase
MCGIPVVEPISYGHTCISCEATYDVRVQANTGAKNHAVVMPDADFDSTVKALTGAAFGAAGQRCMAISAVVLVGQAMQWQSALVKHARQLRVCNSHTPRGICC